MYLKANIWWQKTLATKTSRDNTEIIDKLPHCLLVEFWWHWGKRKCNKSWALHQYIKESTDSSASGLILGLRPANETSLQYNTVSDWAQTWNQPALSIISCQTSQCQTPEFCHNTFVYNITCGSPVHIMSAVTIDRHCIRHCTDCPHNKRHL